MANTATKGVEGPRAYLNEDPQPFRVERDGGRDLSFQGWKLGESCVDSGRSPLGFSGVPNKRTCVTIYVTAGGKFIAHVSRGWNGLDEWKDEAGVLDTGEELLRYLEESSGGSLGRASRDAWNKACAAYPPLTPLAVETIE
jgi:hypothetical protein